MSTASGEIYDWHSPHNDKCPQNDEDKWTEDCTCPKPVKRKRQCDIINRACVKKHLLEETNSRQTIRIFTQVSKSALDAIQALVKREIIRRAEDPPRKGKTL